MLNPRKQLEKTYEQVMQEAYSEIPIYSEEWTNYNPSDPGITILENLLSFTLLQSNQLDTTDDKVKQMLLKLAGFEPYKSRGARVLLAAENVTAPLVVPENQRFYVGSMSYETNKKKELLPCRITGVYARCDEELKNYSYIYDSEVELAASIFGEHPKVGSQIYIVMNQVPQPMKDSFFYATVGSEYKRNPLGEKEHNHFAKIEWECYTEKGFVPMAVKDDTECFLVDGEMRFRMPQEPAAQYSDGEISGYVFRGTLVKAQYDMPPKLMHLSGFLLEVWQKETLAIVSSYPKNDNVLIQNDMMELGYYKVLCREDKGSSYRMYEEIWDTERTGRFYTTSHLGPGRFELHFNKQKYGYAPVRLKNAIRVITYNQEMMQQYYIGEVRGYDNQEMELPKDKLISDSFCILAMRLDEEGVPYYDFVKPDRNNEGELYYHLYENVGRIVIREAGEFIGAKLFIASIAVTEGEAGNIRRNNRFVPMGEALSGIEFTNPAPGIGGRHMETLEDTRRRYVQDIHRPYTAVCARDYEELVLTTPGLCIHKVRAYMNEEKNLVEVVVKPYTTESFPKLSEDYIHIIDQRLQQCRLLSTKVRVLQPVYIPVHVHGVIYVKRHYENSRAQVEKALREALDFVNGEQQFGETVYFDRIVRKIELLDCVAHVYDLSLSPAVSGGIQKKGADLILQPDCLCYPGNFSIEYHTYEQEN